MTTKLEVGRGKVSGRTTKNIFFSEFPKCERDLNMEKDEEREIDINMINDREKR